MNMPKVVDEIHVRILGIDELVLLMAALERNLPNLPADVVSAYSAFQRDKPSLKLVVDNRDDTNG